MSQRSGMWNDKRMVRPYVIPPACSGEIIAAKAKHVQIHEDGLKRLAKEIVSSMESGKISIPECGGDGIHPYKEHPKAVDWIFVTDALNFCFWSIGDPVKWKVEGQTGYNALAAALSRAIREGRDVTNPNYYSRITEEEFNYLMRSDDDQTPVPMLIQRIEVLHNVGKVLLERFKGTFEECVKQAKGSAIELLKIVVNEFECFRDEAKFEGETVSFYKRAQILVADLWNCFEGKQWGQFEDIDKLTMFADYRVPQVLVYFGVMSYSNELNEKLKNDVLLDSGSLEEIEIRGCSVHAVELLKNYLRELLASKENTEVPNSLLIDYYLWCYRRKYNVKLNHIPFHKVISIYY